MNRPLRFATLAILVAVPSPTTTAQIQPQCVVPTYSSISAGSAAERWNNDRAYSLIVRDAPASPPDRLSKDIYIVSDRLHLAPKDFAFLSRAADRPLTKIRNITFDAREVIVDMPLIFDSATVKIVASRVVFLDGAYLSLSGGVPGGREDGLTIEAETIDLSQNTRIAPLFLFATDNWAAYPNNGADAPPKERWNRYLRITANQIRTAGPPPADWFEAVRGLTRDRDAGRHGQNAGYSRRPYQLEIGTEKAQTRLNVVVRDEANWPIAFSAKLLRHFAGHPYDPDAARFRTELMDASRIREILAPRGNVAKPRFASSLAALATIQAATISETDLFGRRREFVPRLDVEYLLTDFKEQVQRAEANATRAIEVVKVIGAADARVKLRAQHAGELQAERTALQAQMRERNSALLEEKRAFDVAKQDQEGLQAEIQAYKESVMREARRKGEDIANIKVFADAVTFSVTAVVSYVATPAVGASVGAGLSYASDSYIRNQKGEPISNAKDVDEALAAARQRGQQWKSRAVALADDATAVWNSARDGKTVEEQLELTLNLLRRAAAAREAFTQTAMPPDEGTVFREGTAASDELRSLVDRLKGATGAMNQAGAQIEQIGTQLVAAQTRLKEIDGLIVLADSAEPKNEREAAQQKALIAAVVSRSMLDLAFASSDLVRSIRYFTGQELPVDPRLLEVNTLTQAEQLLIDSFSCWEASTPNCQPLPTEAAIAQASLDRLKENIRLVHVLIEQLEVTLREQLSRRNGYQEVVDNLVFVNLPGSERTGAQFVSAIEREINRQVSALRRRTRPQPSQIRIPLTTLPSTRLGDLFDFHLVSARISPVPQGIGLDFTVVHPGYGVVQRGSSCEAVSFVVGGPRARDTLKFLASYDDSGLTTRAEAGYKPPQRVNYLHYPFRADYWLEVTVHDRGAADVSKWQDVRVDELKFSVTSSLER